MKSEESTTMTEGIAWKEMRLFNFESSRFHPVKAWDTQCVILFLVYFMPFRMCNNEEDEEV